MKRILFILFAVSFIFGCKKDHIHEVKIVLHGDAEYRHVLNQSYEDAGAYGLDYMNKHLPVDIDVSGVNVNQTGIYVVKITSTDEYGNIGTAQRVVTVYNEVEYLQGNWSFYKYEDGNSIPDTIYIETINVSPTINRLFKFTRFSNYDNAPIQAHIEANLITIDSLQYSVGPTSSLNISIYGVGTQINNSRLDISYSEIINNITNHYFAQVIR